MDDFNRTYIKGNDHLIGASVAIGPISDLHSSEKKVRIGKGTKLV